MRVCENYEDEYMYHHELNVGDVFKYPNNDNLIMMKREGNAHIVLISPITKDWVGITSHPMYKEGTRNRYTRVILYPDACIRLGEPRLQGESS